MNSARSKGRASLRTGFMYATVGVMEREEIGEIEGCVIYLCRLQGARQWIEYTAKMAVCCDGMPVNEYHDKHWQRGTAYYNNGKYLNADEVPYIVVPPFIIGCVPEIVMGCMSHVFNTVLGDECITITGESGPPDKLGEGSCECARRAGMSGNPNHGGTDEHIIRYRLWPGLPARVDGVTYKLQPS